MLVRSKLNSIKSKISETLINNEVSHEDFTTIINEEKNYRELKHSIRTMKTKEVILKKIIWLTKVKEKVLIKLLGKMHEYKMMISYCWKCRKNTESINPRVSKTINNKIMLLSICAVCGTKKLRFIKEIEANELLSSLGIKTTLSKIPLLGNVLF